MKLTVSFFLVVSFSWCIGLKGIIIPENAHELSTAGAGIAGGREPGLNPAMNVSKQSYLQFSLNQWLGDIKGSYIAYHWGRELSQVISLQSWNAKDLQLWGNKPDSSPLGTFGVHYVSAAYSISHHLNTPYHFGLRIQANYSHLYTESMNGISLDAGVLLPLNSFLTAGAVIRHLGYENTNNLRAELPLESGLGMEMKLPFKISILTDAIFKSEKNIDTRVGIRTNWKWLNAHAGTSMYEKRTAHALGCSFNYRQWLVMYSIYHHENSVLGLPQFLDVRRYF